MDRTAMIRLDLRPVVPVRDMAASVAFYERLGGEVVHGGPGDGWVLMQVGTAQIALVAGPPTGDGGVELHLATDAPFERVRRLLPGAQPVTHPEFGPQLLVRSPDGLVVRISRREPDPPGY